jgi:hypothetical protein
MMNPPSNYLRKLGKNAKYEEEEEEEIYFDQTSKHIGSIQKQFLFSQHNESFTQQ